MNVPRPVAVALSTLCAAACSGSPRAAEPQQSAAQVPARAALPRLVFFMNPNGVPCQMQDRVLRDMAPELARRAELVYYRTTDPADLSQFGRYGIRSLPALVLTDAAGREIRRATPGIQSPEQIRRLVGP